MKLHPARFDLWGTGDPTDTQGLGDWPWSWRFDIAPDVAVAGASAISITAATSQVLYLQEAGDPALISVNDIHQGQIGDCFLLSSIGELALFHPSAITNMIHVNANGTETITVYLAASGSLPTYGTTAFKATSVTVDNTFPSYTVNNGATQDVLNGQKEIWVQVLEKAVATLNGGYNGIANGGNPMIAMEELTGLATTWMSPDSLTVQQLQSFIADGDLIVMDTPSSGSLPYNLVNNHAYMFESLTMVGGKAMVQLGNPWGFNQPAAIPLSQLSSGIVEVDIGHSAITGGPGADSITLPAAVTNAYFDLGAGSDTLTFADGTNSATVANVEIIIGGTGDDTITLATAAVAASIDLGGGSDTLTFGNLVNSATVANVETITGGAAADTVTLGSALTTDMAINLGTGSNKLTLSAAGNIGTVSNVNTLVGGAGADTITLDAAVTNTSVDLGTGSDSLTLASGTNSATVRNVETIVGGTGADTVKLASALNAAMSVDLGAGANKLTLAAGGNIGSLSNVSTLIGGTGADTITLNTAAVGASIDLGAGNDTLILANGHNSVTLANVETIIGGAGGDDIVLLGTLARTVSGGEGINFITGNSGGDTFVFDQNGDGNNTIMNFSAARGDLLGLDTTGSATLTNNPFDLGGVALTNGIDIAMVADSAALLAKTLSTGGKGGFVYEQDTGGLYYNSAGNFSGGGTLLGIVTTDGTTPWLYDPNKFIEV